MNIAPISIDLGKTTFPLVALGERNKILLRKKFSRAQLLAYTANLPVSLIGLEACAGAHFVGAALPGQGHEVRLIRSQFVKPYRKSNKNDFLDAEAIAEAGLHLLGGRPKSAQLHEQRWSTWAGAYADSQRSSTMVDATRCCLQARAIASPATGGSE